MDQKKRALGIALLGCGTVGGGVYEFVEARQDMRIVSILSRRPRPELRCRIVSNFEDIVSDPEVDIVIEAMGGLHPAFEYVAAALEAGKHVITANKLLMAAHYRELVELADRRRVALRCSAAVGGGIPWLANLERTLEREPIIRISGIMNGTTNYILDNMHSTGGSFHEALVEAQCLGYAEADPTADICGHDIRRKLVISANIAFGCLLREEDVDLFGIETIQDRDIAAARKMGRVCKLIAAARKLEHGVAAYIEPALVPTTVHEAAVPQNFNLLSLTGLHIGKQSFYGQGAGRYPTAYNVLQDCVDVRNGLTRFYTRKMEPARVENSSVVRRYYVRTNGVDRWLQTHIEKILDCGVITSPVSVAEIHAWARERKNTDAECFIAALRS